MNIEELKRLAEAATPGPWGYDYDDQDHDTCIGILWGTNHYAIATIPYNGQVSDEKVTATGNYIAAANPAAVLELIRQRDELLAALKEAQQQEPVAFWWIGPDGKDNGGPYRGKPSDAAIDNARNMGCEPVLLYAAPVPATAVPSGWNIRRDGDVLIVQHPDIGGCSVQKEPDWERMIPEAILYSLADALHKSRAVKDSLTTQADCRACVNRGRVNGLSQESYCDSCIYQGRDWRQNHFVDVSKMVDEVNRRCEACAILPCSCK